MEQITKEKQRLTKVLEDSEEVRSSSSKQAQVRWLTKELETAQADIESLRGKWGHTAMARDELIETNKALMDWVSQLKLENDKLTKSLDKVMEKQPLSSKANSDPKVQNSSTQRVLDGSNSYMESPSEDGSSSGEDDKGKRSRDKKQKSPKISWASQKPSRVVNWYRFIQRKTCVLMMFSICAQNESWFWLKVTCAL